MKVLHTLDSLNRGGAEIMELDICRNAAAAGLDLTLVATGGGGLEADFAGSGVDFVRLTRRMPVDPFLVKKLRRIIKDREVRVVHAQQPVEAIHLYLATLGTDVRCAMTLHGYIFNTRNRIAARFIIPRLDAVFAVSRAMLEWYRSGEGFEITDKFHVLHNGVDIDRLAPTRPIGQTDLRAELGISSDSRVLGMVGNFYRDMRKDQLTVCHSLPDVVKQFPDAHFVFVGIVESGAESYRQECLSYCREKGIDRNVHFLGVRSDIPDILRELDLFVFSSVQEGLPIAAVEALMLGVPMIVSDIPPLFEVIGDGTAEGRCAVSFSTGNAVELAAKVIALLANKADLQNLGEKAKAVTSARFGIDAHLQKLRSYYGQMAADR